MEVLGIGLPEFVLILVIIFLVLGPKDMASTARRIARTIRTLTQSEFWRATREAWRMAQDIPNELLRETGLEEAQKELTQMNRQLNDWSREVDATIKAPDPNRILPPEPETAAQAAEATAGPNDPPPDPSTAASPEKTSVPPLNPSGANPEPSTRTDE